MAKILKSILILMLSSLIFIPGRTNSYETANRKNLYQSNWGGGVNNSVVKFYNLNSWTYYSEAHGVSIQNGRPGPIYPFDNPYVISSPIDIETGELVAVYGSTGRGTVVVRQSDSVGGLSSAGWFSVPNGRVTKRYFQYKILYGDMGEERLNIIFSGLIFQGTVRNSSGGNIRGWKICIERDNCAYQDNIRFIRNYILSDDFNRPDNLTRTLTVSAPGYITQVHNVKTSYYVPYGLGHGGGYKTTYNFVLRRGTGTIRPTTPTHSGAIPIATAAPTPPSIKKIMVGSREISGDFKQLEFKKEDRKIFSGETVPNSEVILYFHSDPFEDRVKTNQQGFWEYDLKRDLGEGDHTLQLAVIDSSTNLTSEKSAPVNFKISKETVKFCCYPKSQNNYFLYYAIGGVLVLVLCSILFFLILKRRKTAKIVPNKK